jgi:hypothetical protein
MNDFESIIVGFLVFILWILSVMMVAQITTTAIDFVMEHAEKEDERRNIHDD